MVCPVLVCRAVLSGKRLVPWALLVAAMVGGAAPALARHEPPPIAPPGMVPGGEGPGPCSVPGVAGGEPQWHGWPPPCEAMPAPPYPGPPYAGTAYPGPGYYRPGYPPSSYPPSGYPGSWMAPPGYYVAGVVMVPVPVPRASHCQPCGETRTVTTTRVVDVPVRRWRHVPPRHPPLHDKRVKEKRIKE